MSKWREGMKRMLHRSSSILENRKRVIIRYQVDGKQVSWKSNTCPHNAWRSDISALDHGRGPACLTCYTKRAEVAELLSQISTEAVSPYVSFSTIMIAILHTKQVYLTRYKRVLLNGAPRASILSYSGRP